MARFRNDRDRMLVELYAGWGDPGKTGDHRFSSRSVRWDQLDTAVNDFREAVDWKSVYGLK